MTDVVEIAMERQAIPAAEISKLDNFIRMAQTLLKYRRSFDRAPVMDANSPALTVLLADSDRDAFRFFEELEARDDVAARVSSGCRLTGKMVDALRGGSIL